MSPYPPRGVDDEVQVERGSTTPPHTHTHTTSTTGAPINRNFMTPISSPDWRLVEQANPLIHTHTHTAPYKTTRLVKFQVGGGLGSAMERNQARVVWKPSKQWRIAQKNRSQELAGGAWPRGRGDLIGDHRRTASDRSGLDKVYSVMPTEGSR